jgi:hypothetical protein
MNPKKNWLARMLESPQASPILISILAAELIFTHLFVLKLDTIVLVLLAVVLVPPTRP